MKAIKITIETDESVNLVLEGQDADKVFSQIRFYVYPRYGTPEFENREFRDAVTGRLANRYSSPYAQYIAVHVPIGEHD